MLYLHCIFRYIYILFFITYVLYIYSCVQYMSLLDICEKIPQSEDAEKLDFSESPVCLRWMSPWRWWVVGAEAQCPFFGILLGQVENQFCIISPVVLRYMFIEILMWPMQKEQQRKSTHKIWLARRRTLCHKFWEIYQLYQLYRGKLKKCRKYKAACTIGIDWLTDCLPGCWVARLLGCLIPPFIGLCFLAGLIEWWLG